MTTSENVIFLKDLLTVDFCLQVYETGLAALLNDGELIGWVDESAAVNQ